ncbi:MAG: carbon-nitrogen hydrolase family protein [Bacilli bacterium]|nr:carbon-nitrogen hydrolase family protein [Bacilli bacterium]
MNTSFNIALLQLNAVDNQKEALIKGIEYCEKAKKLNADMAVFPEMWNTGYEMLFEGDLKDQNKIDDEKIKLWANKAIDNNDDFIMQFRNTAKKLQIAIVLTYLEKTKAQPKNTAIIIDKDGNIILKYSKVHTVDSKMEAYMQPGDRFQTCELDYGRGKVKLGTMICFDRDFPESARILMLQGSEIIIVPNACYMSQIRLEQLKVRAYENMVGIVCVNYANHGGKSSAYSPIVRDQNKHELNSEMIIMNKEEGISVVEYDMKVVRDYRKRETFGDAYRKPYAYSQLIDNNIKEPFIRPNSRRK